MSTCLVSPSSTTTPSSVTSASTWLARPSSTHTNYCSPPPATSSSESPTMHCSLTHNALQSHPQSIAILPTIHCYNLTHNALQSPVHKSTAVLPNTHNALLQSHPQSTVVLYTVHCSITHNAQQYYPQCTAVTHMHAHAHAHTHAHTHTIHCHLFHNAMQFRSQCTAL